ncbi:MAG: hypothetical protein LCH90_14440 [Proteobacteria bacterium]|nr:hypothetical protein [Pseudomonadota bacterium]
MNANTQMTPVGIGAEWSPQWLLSAEQKALRSRPAPARGGGSQTSGGGDEHLRCCDGTRSPTCTYGRASYRGCCSHHGGVC